MIPLLASSSGVIDLPLAASLSPLLTFARASSGTQIQNGALSTVGNDVARFETAWVGWLGEPQRTNLLFPSVNWFANGTASGSVDGVVQSAAVAPDGASTAMALIPGSFSGNHQYYRIFPGAISTTYTMSVVAKVAGLNYLTLSLENTAFPSSQFAGFNLASGTVAYQCANGSAKIVSLSGGYYRCSVSNTSTGAGGNYVANVLPQATGVFAQPWTGDATSGVLVWGEQVEASDFATSYVATTGSASTRATDNLYLALSLFPALQTAAGYGVALDFSLIGVPASGLVVPLGLAGSGGAFVNGVYAQVNASNQVSIVSIVASASVNSGLTALNSVFSGNKIALSISPTGVRFSVNGGTVQAIANAGQPSMTSLGVGGLPTTAGNAAAMHATKLSLVPGPQSDAWLKSRST